MFFSRKCVGKMFLPQINANNLFLINEVILSQFVIRKGHFLIFVANKETTSNFKKSIYTFIKLLNFVIPYERSRDFINHRPHHLRSETTVETSTVVADEQK